MNWLILLLVMMTTSQGPVGITAMAVMPDSVISAPERRTPAVNPEQESAPAASISRFAVPVQLQLTRSRLSGKSAITTTENFRETWVLELRTSGSMFLESPRGRIQVFHTSESTSQGQPGLPERVLTNEADFALLVGIAAAQDGTSGGAGVEPPRDTRPVTIVLGRGGKAITEISFTLSEEEHFAVMLDVGQQPAL